MIDIVEHLICPDCRGKIELSEQVVCKRCNRVFSHYGNALNLLPAKLCEADLAEEHFWMTDKRQSMKVHPLISLMVSRDPIFYFYEQLLPKLKLEGVILEIGSGTCWLSSFVKSAFPKTYVVATDVSPNALLKGIQVCRFLNSKIDKFIACKVENLPFESGLFDHVIGASILHHTRPEEAISQICRVLKSRGTYIGLGEVAMPRLLGVLWGSRIGIAGRREKELGVREGNYDFKEWKRFFHNAGFRKVRLALDRDPQYRTHWFIHLYYKAASRIPEAIVSRYLATSIVINAQS